MASTRSRRVLESVSRRSFLKYSALTAGAVASGVHSFNIPLGAAAKKAALPAPSASGIEHVVVVMMENRSFDHFLGWLPGANGRQSGLSYTDRNGAAHSTYPLAPDYQGCGYNGPDHTYEGARVEYNGGACDGWLRAGSNDLFSIGYYTQNDLGFLGQAAPGWTTCDNYFATLMAETTPNRMCMHSAQTDRLHNDYFISNLPTIWDRLIANGISAKYYYSDIPHLVLWGAKYLPIARHVSTFIADCAAGSLPAVSYVDPKFFSEDLGTSNDDHPFADIRNGEAFLYRIYRAVTTSPQWDKTVLIINFDEWGGFFDHVAPPSVPQVPATDRAAGYADNLRGFRVPALVISPWSPRSTVAHGVYDHTSILKMIEWRWSLAPLSVRDQTANNIADVLDFSTKNLAAPDYATGQGPYGKICPPNIGISFNGTNSVLKFPAGDRALQGATSILGPWNNVTNALSPYTVTGTNTSQFFRVQPDIFSTLGNLASQYGFSTY